MLYRVSWLNSFYLILIIPSDSTDEAPLLIFLFLKLGTQAFYESLKRFVRKRALLYNRSQ